MQYETHLKIYEGMHGVFLVMKHILKIY